jgi:hypothetical protein
MNLKSYIFNIKKMSSVVKKKPERQDMEYKTVQILLETYTKEELAQKLSYYNDLERNGCVYSLIKPVDHYTVIELISMVSKKTTQEVKALIDIRFSKTKKKQYRSIEKYNRHHTYMKLSGKVAHEFFKEHKGSSPRIKVSKETEDIPNCRSSGFKNVYPLQYKEVVKNFLKEYPLNKWHEEFDIKGFEKTENGKYKCDLCSKSYCRQYRNKHKCVGKLH